MDESDLNTVPLENNIDSTSHVEKFVENLPEDHLITVDFGAVDEVENDNDIVNEDSMGPIEYRRISEPSVNQIVKKKRGRPRINKLALNRTHENEESNELFWSGMSIVNTTKVLMPRYLYKCLMCHALFVNPTELKMHVSGRGETWSREKHELMPENVVTGAVPEASCKEVPGSQLVTNMTDPLGESIDIVQTSINTFKIENIDNNDSNILEEALGSCNPMLYVEEESSKENSDSEETLPAVESSESDFETNSATTEDSSGSASPPPKKIILSRRGRPPGRGRGRGRGRVQMPVCEPQISTGTQEELMKVVAAGLSQNAKMNVKKTEEMQRCRLLQLGLVEPSNGKLQATPQLTKLRNQMGGGGEKNIRKKISTTQIAIQDIKNILKAIAKLKKLEAERIGKLNEVQCVRPIATIQTSPVSSEGLFAKPWLPQVSDVRSQKNAPDLPNQEWTPHVVAVGSLPRANYQMSSNLISNLPPTVVHPLVPESSLPVPAFNIDLSQLSQ